MTKTIAWITATLDQVGGGERLIQEGALYYRSLGYRVLLITWSYRDEATFDGEYEERDVIVMGDGGEGKSAARALKRLQDVPRLRRVLKENNVDLVFVQSEYDVALAYMATRFSAIPYRFLIFGQMFQFPEDYAKYSLVFRRHLREIVESCEGYRITTSQLAPKLRFVNRWTLEFICIVRFLAVRAAQRRFVFTRQIGWETKLLYGKEATIAHGAYRRYVADTPVKNDDVLQKLGLTNKKYILSLSRLAPKKRIELIIRAYAQSGIEDLLLVVGGGGSERQSLEQVAAASGCADRIRFLGRVADDEMMPLKAGANLFVSMDIGDYDISPLEALVLGTPIVLPREFDADSQLGGTPGVTICDALEGPVAEAMREARDGTVVASAKLLDEYSWEYYFSVLAE